MRYDFDKMTDRHNTGSMKWEVKDGELPMWVADMDFMTAPEIISAVKEKADFGIYGYSIVPKEWYKAVSRWWRTRHGFEIEEDWLIFSTGVVPAVSSIVRKLTTPGENILVQTPVYNIFFNCITNNGRNVLENKLKFDGKEYRMDFEDLEEKLKNPQTTMMLLCNPHNPTGNIWDKQILERVGMLCHKYHVTVVSDEIHCDLTRPGYDYVPFGSVSQLLRQISITLIAPTKAFNLAGLQSAAAVVPDAYLRHKVNRALNTDEAAEPNVFAAHAAVAAYTHGGEWLNQLREYLWENRRFAEEWLAGELPQVKPVPANATYLMWLDFRKVVGAYPQLCDFIRTQTGLYLCDGMDYRNGRGFMRMNLACPRERLRDGLLRLKKGVDEFEKWIVEQC